MSLLSALAAVTLVGFVVFCSPVHSAVGDAGGFGQVLTDNVINSRIFIGLGVLSTAMACQHGAFIVSNSLRDLTPRRWGLVSSSSIAISGALCLLIGVAGYLGFLDETQGVILNNFDADSMIANAGRGLLAVTMFFTYPTKGTCFFRNRYRSVMRTCNTNPNICRTACSVCRSSRSRGAALRR